jgi:DNA-binding NarL/FixJ family response regulator
MTRILIADDHNVVRSGLRAILGSQPGWEVVAEAKDGRHAVELAGETQPDVAILDYRLPMMNDIDATRQIQSFQPRTEVLIFTMHGSEPLIRELLEAPVRALEPVRRPYGSCGWCTHPPCPTCRSVASASQVLC